MFFKQAYDPIRALGAAWKIVVKAPLTMLIGGFLLTLLGGGGGVASRSFQGEVDHIQAWAVALIVVAVAGLCLVGIAVFCVHCVLMIGFPAAVERVMSTGREDLADLFLPRGLFWWMLLTRLLQGLIGLAAFLPFSLAVVLGVVMHEALDAPAFVAVIVGLGTALLYVPVCAYVWLGISLATRAVAIEGMPPTEAISRSWSLVRGNRWWLLLYYIVMSVVELSGVCLCCVGVFGTATWSEVAQVESYLRLVRVGEPETWKRPQP